VSGGSDQPRQTIDPSSAFTDGGTPAPIGVPSEPFLGLVTEALCTTDADGRFTSLSGSWDELCGRPQQELLGRSLFDLLHSQDAPSVREALHDCRERGDVAEFLARCPSACGVRLLRWRARWIGAVLYASITDLTDTQLAELTLRERERTLSTLMGNLPGMAYRCANDPQWTMEFVSAGCEELTGYAPEALIGNAVVAYGALIDGQDAGQTWTTIQAAIERHGAWTTTYRIITAGGRRKWVWERGIAVRDDDGRLLALEGLVIDHTAQREAEERLAAAAADWITTFDAMQDSIAVIGDDNIIVRCNAATAALTGVPREDIPGRPCYEVFHGTQGPPHTCPHQMARCSGRAETKTRKDGDKWLRVTFQPTPSDDGVSHQGVHVVSDVTELKHAEEQLLHSIARSDNVTKGVIGAIAQLVETRDPYTAGHQRGVGELAAAIARHLGLDAEAIEGVRVAGMLHDVGKTSIPAEILIKPGALSVMEFRLVKEHPGSGYEILRGIEFPWPVALAALQHHERLDGSGYPSGLHDEDIVPEARIIAVADVVEAMASHRPYRPALGLEVALGEIKKYRGTKYDLEIVDACVAVFAGGFELP
jgi:PAS domain S-box-containing protein/putative nucleotidyltransferase with HDIG domain